MKLSALTHLDQQGNARMVDVGEKPESRRLARAQGGILMKGATLDLILSGLAKKGDVLGVARIAGIQATKRTSDLIPLCHPLALTKVEIAFTPVRESSRIEVLCTVESIGRTGVEMEALTGACVAMLTIYDMCKAVDREMKIGEICLLEKSGGKSGHFQRGQRQGG